MRLTPGVISARTRARCVHDSRALLKGIRSTINDVDLCYKSHLCSVVYVCVNVAFCTVILVAVTSLFTRINSLSRLSRNWQALMFGVCACESWRSMCPWGRL